MLRLANLALLILFPVAWFAPLLRAGFLPLFGLSEISVVTGLQSLVGNRLPAGAARHLPRHLRALRQDHRPGLAAFGLLSPRTLPALHLLGKLAMADVFLIALYIVVVKGVGLATSRPPGASTSSPAASWPRSASGRGRPSGQTDRKA